jgi:predicted DNA-binding antitoxin AbrB/MazE fold protein
VSRLSEIEGIVKGGVIIPLKSLSELEGKKVKIRIVSVEGVSSDKLYSYLKLLREGEDGEELFDI